ncbi:hypothetical protein HLK56_15800 [Streptomyces sp. G9]|uniref:hypothetical protein n=1 Tax=Streptomyces rubiginosohelvolus TaxID=67362 RepID=UPI000BEFE3D5|nr:hypothetical protein [Streptomyces sp. SID5614]MZG04243.1 hypothetical protein [Streptomyces sp. SID5614]
MPESALPDHAAILRELRQIRRVGVMRLRKLRVPSLDRAAAALGTPRTGPRVEAVEQLLRLAVESMDAGSLREAAAYSLGLAGGTRDLPPAERRRRAAALYGITVDHFRKHQEFAVLGEVAEQVVRLSSTPAAAVPKGPDAARRWPLSSGHRTLPVVVLGRPSTITLHVHPVDLLRDVDVVVSPTNTFLSLPEVYKSSVSASLRRAGALRDCAGGLVEDRVHDQVREWVVRHAAPGRSVLPGTVAPTSAGALAEQGIRRIYHAAIAVPRPGTNDYDVQPDDVTRSAARALSLLAAERDAFDPPLRSICFALLGSGRGGLSHEASLRAVWAAIEAELARGSRDEIHLVVRHPSRADLVERMLAPYEDRRADRTEASRGTG